MQTVLFNRFTPNGARRESLNGRDYIVVPMTLIVPGVLNGSKGPLLYPPDEVAREPSVWNHMPIVVYHPEQDGIPVSARSPSVVARSKVGEVYNTYIDDNGKLKAEGWFDIESTNRVDTRVMASLQHNRPIELSTGLYTDNQPVGIGEVAAYPTYNGKEYHFIARNYRPDHLAILPDQKGACILPGQVVEGNFIRGSKAWYTGEAVRLTTASGHTLSVTSNHPVLTRTGFTPAGQLREGQNLLHYIREHKPNRPNSYEEDLPALVEDVFDSLECMGGVQGISHPLSLNFHGDEKFFKGKVKIVGAERSLGNNMDSMLSQRPEKRNLKSGCSTHTELTSQSNTSQSLRSLGFQSEPFAICCGESGIHGSGSLGSASCQTPVGQLTVENTGRDTSPRTDVTNTFSREVCFDSCLDTLSRVITLEDSTLTPLCVVGSGAELDISLSEFLPNSSNVDLVSIRDIFDRKPRLVISDPKIDCRSGNDSLLEAPTYLHTLVDKSLADRRCAEIELFCQLPKAFPGKVLTDKIISIYRFLHDGPVYDFQTTTGYMVAEGLIISNCSLSDGCGVLINMESEPNEPCCDSCKKGKPCECDHNENDYDEDDQLITDNVRESFLTWLGRTIGVLNYDPNQARDENGRWVKGWKKKKQKQAQAEAAVKAEEAPKAEPTKSDAPTEKATSEPTKHYHKTVVKIVNPPATPLPPAPASVGSKVDDKILSSLADDIKTLTRDGQNLRVALAGLSEKVSMLSMMSLQSQMASLQSKVGGFTLSEADQSLIKKIADHILTMGKDTAPVKEQKSEPAKPTKVKRPLDERLKQIRDREQSKGTPYIDMVMYVLKQDRGSHSPVVPQNVTYTQLFKDLQRQARGEKPIHIEVPRKELASALKTVSNDFGKLSTKELYRLLPHMTYTEQEAAGITGTDVIRQRHIPQTAVDKVLKSPTTNQCPHLDNLTVRVRSRLADDRRLLTLLIMQLFNDCDGDAEELACSLKWLASQMPDSRPTGNQLLLNMLYGTPLPLNRST